jgi:hypothetical protein
MLPFTDVYGIVAPLRVTWGFVATSVSYSASCRRVSRLRSCP